MYSTAGGVSVLVRSVLERISRSLSPNKIIAVTWIFSLHLALPPLLGWSNYTPEPSGLR